MIIDYDEILALLEEMAEPPAPRTCREILGVEICLHYGMDLPVFWPVMYLTERGQVIRCPACGRKVVETDSATAIERWNREVAKET